MILRPERPESPIGPPMTKRPVGLTRWRVSSSRSSDGDRLPRRRARGSRRDRSSASTSGSCWVLTRTVWTRRGRPSGSYSTVTWLLPSGRRNGQRAVPADLGQPRATRWASMIAARHQLVGLVGRVAEHHALVAGAERSASSWAWSTPCAMSGDWSLIAGQGPARLPVEAEPAVVVADVADGACARPPARRRSGLSSSRRARGRARSWWPPRSRSARRGRWPERRRARRRRRRRRACRGGPR